MSDETAGDGADTFELLLTGTGVSLRRTISAELAGAVVALVVTGRPPQPTQVVPDLDLQTGAAARMSVGEFIAQVHATSYPEKIAAIAAFLGDHRGKETFAKEDIRAQFKAAREPFPANYRRDFARAMARRWIAQADQLGTYYLTSTGKKAVNRGFGPDSGKS
jgi:hypothetical protein